MTSLANSSILYRFITWLFFHKASRGFLVKALKKAASSRLQSGRNNKFSNRSPRIRQEKILMIESILHSIETSIEKGNLKKEVVKYVLKLWGSSLTEPVRDNDEIKRFREKNG